MKRKLLLLVCTLFMMGALLQVRAQAGEPLQRIEMASVETLPTIADAPPTLHTHALPLHADARVTMVRPHDTALQTVRSDATTEDYRLTVVTEGTSLPDSFKQWETGSFTVRLTNTGTADFTGNLTWLLFDPESNKLTFMDGSYEPMTVRMGSSVTMTFNYNMEDVAAGTYKLCICIIELYEQDGITYLGNYIPIAFEDGSTGKTIQVTESQQPEVQFIEGTVQYPTSVPGYETTPAFLWGTDYTLTTTMSVMGADFTGQLYAILMRLNEAGTQYDLYHISEPLNVSLTMGETQQLTFSGHMNSNLEPGQYIFAFMDANYKIIRSEQGNLFYTYVIYPLEIQTDGSTIPDIIKQHKDESIVLNIRNTGGSTVDDYLYMAFENPETGQIKTMSYAHMEIPVDGTFGVTIPYNAGDYPAGEANLCFGYISNNNIYCIPFMPEGDIYHSVTIEANEGPKLSYIAAQSTLPREVVQNHPFTAEVVLRNDGADFAQNVYFALVNGEGSIMYLGTPEPVTLQRGETKAVTLGGVMNMELTQPRPVAYFIYILYSNASGLQTIVPDDGLLNDLLIVHPDPRTHAVLSWLTADTQLPDAFVAGQSHALSLPVANTGKADYTGEVGIILTQDGTSYPASTRLGETTFAAESTTTLTGMLTLPTDMEPGTYNMQIVLLTDNFITGFIPTEDLMYNIPVTVAQPVTSLPGTQVRTMLYPNPATDHVTVASGEGIVQVCTYTVTGALMARETSDGATQCTLRTDAWPQGVYVLEITTPQGVHTQRLVKE